MYFEGSVTLQLSWKGLEKFPDVAKQHTSIYSWEILVTFTC